MRLSIPDISQNVATIGFFLLFPGFLFYHTFVAIGIMPRFLAGFFTPTSILLFIFLVPLFVYQLQGQWKKDNFFEYFLILFFFYVVFWTIIYFVLSPEPESKIAANQSFQTLLLWATCVLVGCYLNVESRHLKLFLTASLAIIFFYLIYYVATTGSVFFYAREFFEAEGGVATYQGFARSALVMCVLLMVVVKSQFFKLLTIIASFFVLFLLGARSELYAFFVLVVFLYGLISLKRIRTALLYIAIILVFAVVIAYFFDYLYESRHFEIYGTSWLAREQLHKQAVEHIKQNPFIGQFAGHIVGDSEGYYAHNALSAWVNYGVVGFIMYASLILVAFIHSAYKVIIKGINSSRWQFSLYMNFVVALLVIFSKSVFWVIPALGWGIYINAKNESK